MTKRAAAIAAVVYLFFIAEFVLYNTVGMWGKPELMVLAVIFCNLYWGIKIKHTASGKRTSCWRRRRTISKTKQPVTTKNAAMAREKRDPGW